MRKKIKLYNEALQKSERDEQKVADAQPKTAEKQILSDLEEQMEENLHLQKPPREKIALYRVSVKFVNSYF